MMKTKGDNHIVNVIGFSQNGESETPSIYYYDTRNSKPILTKRDINVMQTALLVSFEEE